ncbi:SH3 domain-containing protein [Chitinophaga sp. YIM B06452]|uniref:SH3 domain-containing protein n=1 Tax=Chitinophaga sp. YIM B06452 TaxID=3082158 RepID=UPI0031FEE175
MKLRLFLFLLPCLASAVLHAQNFEVARISDPDGYTNIRTAPNAQSEVAGKLLKDEFFYCERGTGDWWKVSSYGTEGYVHRSRIQLFRDLPDSAKEPVFRSNFQQYAQLTEKFNRAYDRYNEREKRWKNREDSVKYAETRSEKEKFHETRYAILLGELPGYFCRTKDAAIIKLLFELEIEDSGSASETPDFALGECYICQPDALLQALAAFPRETRSGLCATVAFGLGNLSSHFDQEENDPAFKRLSKRLEDAAKAP